MLLAELAREYQMNIVIGDYKSILGDGCYIGRSSVMLDVSRRKAMLLALMICLAMILLIGFVQKACGVAANTGAVEPALVLRFY